MNGLANRSALSHIFLMGFLMGFLMEGLGRGRGSGRESGHRRGREMLRSIDEGSRECEVLQKRWRSPRHYKEYDIQVKPLLQRQSTDA